MAEIRATLPPGTPVEVWFQDEMRVGQKNKLTYRWARKGSRPTIIAVGLTQGPLAVALVGSFFLAALGMVALTDRLGN